MDEKMLQLLLSTILFATFPLFAHVFFEHDQPYFMHNETAYKLDWSPITEPELNYIKSTSMITSNALSTLERRPNRRRDLKPLMSKVRDQDKRSTCGTFATIALVEHITPNMDYSEQCTAYLAGSTDRLSMLTLIDHIKRRGLYDETQCPYRKPSDNPQWHRATPAERETLTSDARNDIPDLSNLKKHHPQVTPLIKRVDSLSQEQLLAHVKNSLDKGAPVAVTTYVFGDQWNSGLIDTLPTAQEIDKSCRASTKSSAHKQCAAHALVFTGYDDQKQLFYFKNSWHTTWGLTDSYELPRNKQMTTGYGAMSYEYFAKYRINELISLAS